MYYIRPPYENMAVFHLQLFNLKLSQFPFFDFFWILCYNIITFNFKTSCLHQDPIAADILFFQLRGNNILGGKNNVLQFAEKEKIS